MLGIPYFDLNFETSTSDVADWAQKRQIHRDPENEQDTLAVLWKLEALKGLPFTTFDTLEHGGSGADLIAHFRENMESNPERFATVEAEYVFTNYKAHGHNPSQMPIVICWDVSKNRKIKLKDTNIAWKFIAEAEETNVRVYVLSRMPNLQVGRSK